MFSSALRTRRGVVTIRPLRPGDTRTVAAVLEQLSERSLQLRFGYARPLRPEELELLARVDGERHVLVAWAGSEPVGVAHLARDDEPGSAEIAYAVADEWQGLGVGRALGGLLAADARAAGIEQVRAF
jgi:GNAT superfamily N-acetyltransferase